MMYYHESKIKQMFDEEIINVDCYESKGQKVVELQLHKPQMLIEFSKEDLLYMLRTIEENCDE